MTVSDLLKQPCNKSDNIHKVVASCQQLVANLSTTCNNQCQHNLLTACLQTCYKLYKDFFVCEKDDIYHDISYFYRKSGRNRHQKGFALSILTFTMEQ